MKLYFLRHGIAVDAGEWNGDDGSRPLTDDGRKQMEREAKAIAKLDIKIDCIITSPLTRAKETAQILAERLGMEDRMIEDERLAGNFDDSTLKLLVRDRDDNETIMLVGHEPDFSKTISQLIGGGTVELKKGGLARIDVPDAQNPVGALEWLLPAKVLLQ